MTLHLLPLDNRDNPTGTPHDDSDLDRPAPSGQDAPPFGKDAGKDAHAHPRAAAPDADHTTRRPAPPDGTLLPAGSGAGGEAPSDAGDALADAHTIARRHRAFALHCQGYRTAPIAEKLGVTPRTVRNYLQDYTDQIALEHRVDRDKNLLRAIESQRAIAAAAWDSYEREAALQQEILAGRHDHVCRRIVRPGKPGRPRKAARPDGASDAAADALPAQTLDDLQDGDLVSEAIEWPRLPAQGARYLALALAAQKEIARLQRLYDAPAEEPTNIEITIVRRPDGPENIPPAGAIDADYDPDAPDAPEDADRANASTATTGDYAAVSEPDPDTADDDDVDLLDPGDAVPTVTRRAAPTVAAKPSKPATHLAVRHGARRRITRTDSSYGAPSTTPRATRPAATLHGTPLPAGRGAGGEVPVFRTHTLPQAPNAHEFSAQIACATAQSGKKWKRVARSRYRRHDPVCHPEGARIM